MTNYKVVFKKSVAKDLRSIPKVDIKKILSRIDSLANDPTPIGSERLSGLQRYRIRQGNYRILYEIEEHIVIVTIVKVGHRRDVYRN